MDYNVYNYLTANYVPRATSKYDVHKKSELRDIVSEILESNKKSPLFLVKLSEHKQDYALDLKETAIETEAALTSMHEDGMKSVFALREAYSEDEKSVAAKVVNQNADLPMEFDLQVRSLAKSQRNTGVEYFTDSKGLPEGTYAFRLQSGEGVYDFQYRVRRDDTQGTVMEGLSSFINKADAGVKASVDYSGGNGKASLVLTSVETGTAQAFSLQDTSTASDGRGIVSYFNLNHVDRAAEDAVAVINGQEKASQSNSFLLNRAVNISLHKTTEGAVHISYRPDADKILKGIRDIIHDYNQLMDKTNIYAHQTGYISRLAAELRGVASPHINELEASGITMSGEGKLVMAETLAYDSALQGDMEELFDHKKPNSFASGFLRKAHEIKLNPMEYVEKIMVAYPDTSKPAEGYAYITSKYSGMLFSSYC